MIRDARVAHAARGHTGDFKGLHGGIGAQAAHPGTDLRVQFSVVLYPLVAACKARVFAQLRLSHRVEERGREAVGGGADRDVAVARGEDAEGRQARHRIAAARLVAGAAHHLERLGRDHRSDRAQQRGVLDE